MLNLMEWFQEFFVASREKLILVIDDSPVDRAFAVKALSKHYHVVSADSGETGIEMASSRSPDLIILDYMMQGMNGPQVCGMLKNDARTKDIPVIFLTSMDTPKSFVNGLEQGADSYLIKPVNVRDLKEEVRLRIRQCVVNGKDV